MGTHQAALSLAFSALIFISPPILLAQEIILSENFDSMSPGEIPLAWTTNTLSTWRADASAPSSGSGANNLLHDKVQPGYIDTPVLDLTAIRSGTIRYLGRRTSAYAQSALTVRASIDGGASFPIVVIPAGFALPATAEQYSEVSMPLPVELIAQREVVLRFDAAGGGNQMANIRLDDVEVSGIPAELSAAPASLSFMGEVGTSVVRDLQITNRTLSILTVQAPQVDGSVFTISPSGPVVLAPDQSQSYVATFAPDAVDVFHGSVVFHHDLGTTAVPLSGSSGVNTFGFAQAESSVLEGAEYVEVPLHLSYANATGLQALQFTVEWDAATLQLTEVLRGSGVSDAAVWMLETEAEGQNAQVVLLGGGTAELTAGTYAPLLVLRFNTSALSAAAHPQVPLELSGIVSALASPSGHDAAVSPGPSTHVLTIKRPKAHFEASALTVDMGFVEAGGAASVPLTVTNPSGAADLVVSGVQADNPLFSVSPASAVVPEGGTQIFDVSFAPTWQAFGWQAGSITFTHDGEGGEAVIAVEGLGHSGLGDVTGDGMVEALDLVHTVDYILQRIVPLERQRLVSDAYPFGTGDGRLDVQDATVLSQAVTRGLWPDGQPLPLETMPEPEAGKTLAPSDVGVFMVLQDQRTVVYLKHEQPIRAFQMVLAGAPALTAVQPPVGHVALAEHPRGGATRLLLFSSDGALIPPGEYPIATMPNAAAAEPSDLVYGTAVDSNRARMPVVLEQTVQTDTQEQPGGPYDVALSAPFPNPFSLSTGRPLQISYSIPSQQAVTLDLFDVLGRKVQILVDAHTAPGVHSTAWDGRDARNTPVAPGLYLLRLRVGSVARTRSVIVLP